MPTPNDDFTAGQILSSTECNNFPRGIMALASSTTDYTLTATDVIATGMTVTFSAVANRYYKITYREPLVYTPSAISAYTNLSIKETNAAGTTLQYGQLRTPVAVPIVGSVEVTYIATWTTAASRTIVGTASVSVTTGAPILDRDATFPAFILVEDIGPI